MWQLCSRVVLVVCIATFSAGATQADTSHKDEVYAKSYGKYSKTDSAELREQKRAERLAVRERNAELRKQRIAERQRVRAQRRAANIESRRIAKEKNVERRRLTRERNIERRRIAKERKERRILREKALAAKQPARPNTTKASANKTPAATKPQVAVAPTSTRTTQTVAPVAIPSATPVVRPVPVIATPAPPRESESATARATVRWSVPSRREDGTPLNSSDIQGYEIYLTSDDLESSDTIRITNSRQTEYRFENLNDANYHFSMVTIDSNGVYSRLSPVVSKSIN